MPEYVHRKAYYQPTVGTLKPWFLLPPKPYTYFAVSGSRADNTHVACRHWKRDGVCPKGDRCVFMHGDDTKGKVGACIAHELNALKSKSRSHEKGLLLPHERLFSSLVFATVAHSALYPLGKSAVGVRISRTTKLKAVRGQPRTTQSEPTKQQISRLHRLHRHQQPLHHRLRHQRTTKRKVHDSRPLQTLLSGWSVGVTLLTARWAAAGGTRQADAKGEAARSRAKKTKLPSGTNDSPTPVVPFHSFWHVHLGSRIPAEGVMAWWQQKFGKKPQAMTLVRSLEQLPPPAKASNNR